MIERNDLFHLSFYKKTHFTGSFQDSDGYLSFRSGDGIHWPPSGYDVFCSKITAYDKRLNHM